MEPLNQDAPPLHTFIDFLYDGLEGYVYLAAKDRTNPDPHHWIQEYFAYPTERTKLIKTIEGASKKAEVYIAPALFKEKSGTREHFKCTNVLWADFDGNAPDWNDTNRPSLIVQSSSESHQHVYWRLNDPLTDPSTVDDANRRIAYSMGADSSGWDCTQVLRPPATHNFKRDTPVGLSEYSNNVYDIDVFDVYSAPAISDTTEWSLESLPDPDSVLLGHSFGPDVINIMTKSRDDVADRSATLMQLAYALAQQGLKNNEIMVMLVLADDRLEKFKGRPDRLKRLAHIIDVARNKYPQEEFEEGFALAFGFETFLDTDIEINWLIEPMLMEQGSMLMVGPSGVGKTQLTIQFMIHLALGKDYLHYTIPEAKKVLFLSLEMGHGELKIFMESMAGDLSDQEIALLETNFIVVPHGEPWFLNTPEGQSQLVNLIEEYEPTVVTVDSIGSAVQGNISADENVQPLTKFNDAIKKHYGITVWYIHHMRKAKEGGISQDDVYGNQYILNRSTSTYALVKAKNNTLRLRNFKNRLAKREEDQFLLRTDSLNFISENHEVDDLLASEFKGEPVTDTTESGLTL